jgi:hypothetical protein
LTGRRHSFAPTVGAGFFVGNGISWAMLTKGDNRNCDLFLWDGEVIISHDRLYHKERRAVKSKENKCLKIFKVRFMKEFRGC